VLTTRALQESDEPEEAASESKPATEKNTTEAESKPDSNAKEESDEEKKADKPENKDEAKPSADTAESKTDTKAAEKPEAKKRKTHKVEPKRLKVEVSLDGVFVASKTTEVPLRPEAWTSFEIEEVVEHGQKVREGQTLVKFDDEDLNKAIADLELEQRISELTIRQAEEEMPRLEKTLEMDREEAERTNLQAKEDFERYNEIERPQAVKSANFAVDYYNFMLDYEKDELDQLEKMYAADDLTEETEEVVLKRQRNSVEFAEYYLENAQISRDETLNVRLPRFDIAIKESLDRAEMAEARAKTAATLGLNRARYELQQRKEARDKSLERHAKLIEDRGLMELKSPAEGIVFYGQSVNGRWSETPSLINRYEPHGTVQPGSVVMTIVDLRPVYITASLDEDERPEVADGQKATVTLPADGVDRLSAEVEAISTIPVGPGKFDIDFELTQDQIPDWVVPGMTCKIAVKTYDKKDALTVPKAAIHEDEDDVNKKYVWVVDPDDEEAKPERRDVTLGKRSGDDVEIVKGLKAGDVVSLEVESKKTDD
jgi:multidrug efflux pump subunit AcrA (membrane-fusion protein)